MIISAPAHPPSTQLSVAYVTFYVHAYACAPAQRSTRVRTFSSAVRSRPCTEKSLASSVAFWVASAITLFRGASSAGAKNGSRSMSPSQLHR